MATRGARMLKIVILGDSGVGKTSILNQFVDSEFTSQYKVTIGSDFSTKSIEIDGKYITLQIWDTAGQERFKSLGNTYYRGSNCCILVYDINDPESFNNIEKWKDTFSESIGLTANSNFPFLLLGNKSDMPNHTVQIQAAREYALNNGINHIFEVSAKTADNITLSFETIIRKAIEVSPDDSYSLQRPPIRITHVPMPEPSCLC